VLLVSHDRELLRKLVTRVWELRDGRMRVFDGEFADWEEQRDRLVEAAREEASAREVEAKARDRAAARQKNSTTTKSRGNARDVRRTLEEAEAQVAELEARVAELTAALGDPALYEASDGREQVARLSSELESAKKKLGPALARWEAAMAAADAT
jgi:ATPase subunit of ABC transporter with duplicated ATPase domains